MPLIDPAVQERLRTPVSRETQRDRVLRMLRSGPTCSTTFLERYIPRAGARIWELRSEGHLIETRKCSQHRHETYQIEYFLG